MVVGSNDIDDLSFESETILGIEKYKYVGVIYRKTGDYTEEILVGFNAERKTIRLSDSLL